MEYDYSKDFCRLMEKRQELNDASFTYNNCTLDMVKRSDLKNALFDKELSKQREIVQMMAEGLIFKDTIELVLEDIVYIAVTGNEECAAWARIALRQIDWKGRKDGIIEQIFELTETNKDDNAVFGFSWHLLYDLRYKNALLRYIDRFKDYMSGELSDEDLIDIENLQEW